MNNSMEPRVFRLRVKLRRTAVALAKAVRPGVSILLACLAGLAGLSAQPPQQAPPVFRGGTNVVPLTVTVLDQKGAPVKDLKQSDFTVIENRLPREIVNFFPTDMTAAAPAVGETVQPVSRARDDRVKPQTRRTFLIVLGYGRIEYPTKALEGAVEFVRHRLLPQDGVGVMGFHRTTALTTDHERIAQILERYKKEHEKLVADINWYLYMSRPPVGAGSGGAPIPEKFLKRIDDVFVGSAPAADRPGTSFLRNTTDMLLGMDRVVPVVEKAGQHQERLADILQDSKDSGNELSDRVLLSSRLKLYAGVEYLRYIDGDKHMLFLAGGGIAYDVDDAKVVAQRASDARVIVDLIATNGTSRRGGDAPTDRVVAEMTGGYYTSLEMAVKAVTKVDEATRFSYLLGYTPSSATLDGRYRDVQVKVNRPGVTVQYSHGYFAAVDPPPIELKELIIRSRIETALAYEQQAKDIPLRVTVMQLPRMGIQTEVKAEIVIGAAPLSMPLTDGARIGQLEVRVYCGDAKEEIVGDVAEHLDIKASDEQYQQWLQNGIRRIVRVPAFGTPKFVKVVVYDYGSDRVGSAMVTIK
jgi:VWFA-related protein